MELVQQCLFISQAFSRGAGDKSRGAYGGTQRKDALFVQRPVAPPHVWAQFLDSFGCYTALPIVDSGFGRVGSYPCVGVELMGDNIIGWASPVGRHYYVDVI